MIATTLVDEIRRMLHEGRLSQRKIAVRLSVSRGTVNAVARGKRPDYSARRRREDDGFTPPMGIPVRCSGCGGLVQMPCLLCYIRITMKSKKAARQNLRSRSCRGTTAAASHG